MIEKKFMVEAATCLFRDSKTGMKSLLTMPTEVMAVTVLMMVGIGLNLPA